jgi:hypothetical protein
MALWQLLLAVLLAASAAAAGSGCGSADPLAGRKFLGFQAVPIGNFGASFLRSVHLAPAELAAAKRDGALFQASLMFLGGGRARLAFEVVPLNPRLVCEGAQALRYKLQPLGPPPLPPTGTAEGGRATTTPFRDVGRGDEDRKHELVRWARATFAGGGGGGGGGGAGGGGGGVAAAAARAWLVTLDATPCPAMLHNVGFSADMDEAHPGMLHLVYAESEPHHEEGAAAQPPPPPPPSPPLPPPPAMRFKGHRVPQFFVDVPFSSVIHKHWSGAGGREQWYAAHAHAPGGLLFFQPSCPNLPTLKTRSRSCLNWGGA